MDDGIDTGKVISNIEIPITNDIDLGLLYQLSFIAEGEVFEKAYSKEFSEKNFRNIVKNPIYYSRKEKDLEITDQDSIDDILKKVRAFGVPSICARFYRDNNEYKIISAKIIDNSILNTLFSNAINDEILCIYDTNVLVKIEDKYIRFQMLDLGNLQIGDSFFDFH